MKDTRHTPSLWDETVKSKMLLFSLLSQDMQDLELLFKVLIKQRAVSHWAFAWDPALDRQLVLDYKASQKCYLCTLLRSHWISGYWSLNLSTSSTRTDSKVAVARNEQNSCTADIFSSCALKASLIWINLQSSVNSKGQNVLDHSVDLTSLHGCQLLARLSYSQWRSHHLFSVSPSSLLSAHPSVPLCVPFLPMQTWLRLTETDLKHNI